MQNNSRQSGGSAVWQILFSTERKVFNMTESEKMLAFNRQFVEEKQYEPYMTSKYPERKVAILSCMDTRLTALFPAALGIKNGDVKIIKNAGGMISSPFGSAVRSLLIAVYELGVQEIMVIGHTDCGVQHVNSQVMENLMQQRGVSAETLDMIRYCGVDLENWLAGFDCVVESVTGSVKLLREHPLFPKDITITGYIMDSVTGQLNPIED